MKRSAIKNETEQKLRLNQVFIQRWRGEETGITQRKATEKEAKNHGIESLSNMDKPQRKKARHKQQMLYDPTHVKIHERQNNPRWKKKIRAEIASCGWGADGEGA